MSTGTTSSPTSLAAQRSLFFFHIPKTGGRTVIYHLKKREGSTAIYHPKKSRKFYADLLGMKVDQPAAPRGRHVVGHFASLSLLNDEPHDYVKICFWRQPSEWFLSLYNYRLHRNADRIYRPFTFDAFRRSMLRNPMTEHFLLHCGDVPGLKYFFMSDARKFTRALQLARKFDRFDDIQSVSSALRMLVGAAALSQTAIVSLMRSSTWVSSTPRPARTSGARTPLISYCTSSRSPATSSRWSRRRARLSIADSKRSTSYASPRSPTTA